MIGHKNLMLPYFAISGIIYANAGDCIMTTGIYKLIFKGTKAVYIGKSKNIEKRYKQHLTALKNRTSSQKLLQAYDILGIPSVEILEECDVSQLEELENIYISKYDSVKNGFNTMYETHQSKSSLSGESAALAKHNNETYVEIATMLSQGFTIENICETLCTTRGVVSSIKRLENHVWLKEVIPDIYSKLETQYKLYLKSGLSLEYQGKTIPTVISPTGEKYSVTCINNFAKEHNLDSGGLSRLINKKAVSLKGWRLESTLIVEQKVLSPNGEVFVIPKNGITKFSKEHGLDNSILSKVLKGSVHTHRGWKKYLE